MSGTFDVAVCTGLFQPVMQEHVQAIRQALNSAACCIVILENAKGASTPRHPFTADQRARWLMQEFTQDERTRIQLVGLRTDYDPQRRINMMTALVQSLRPSETAPRCALLLTDDQSVPVPPGWTLLQLQHPLEDKPMRLRNALYGAPKPAETLIRYGDLLPPSTAEELRAWIETDQFSQLRQEWEAIRLERRAWADAPYPPVFVTVDAVVSCAQHVLLIKRGSSPGKGLLALPGGFIDQLETLFQGAVRELREETHLAVSDDELRSSLQGNEVFDAPLRSQRGRVITHAYHFDLTAATLPAIRAADDAADAFWFPIEEIAKRESEFHDDHFLILDRFLQIADWSESGVWQPPAPA